jgi:hypothetical protein
LTFLLLEPQGCRIPRRPFLFAAGAIAMAFAIRNLSVLAYANGFTLWHYKAGKDRLVQVETAGFFADAADMLAEGDMLMVSAPDGGRILTIAGDVSGDVATARLA